MLSNLQALIVTIFTSAVGLVVAFAPNFATSKELIIAIGTQVIAVVFQIVNAVLVKQGIAVGAVRPRGLFGLGLKRLP